MLYDAEYYNTYNIASYSNYYRESNDYLSVEVHKLITNFYTDLIHYESPTITVTDQQVFDDFADEVGLYSFIYEVSKYTSILGEVFVQVYVGEDQKPKLVLHRHNVKILPNVINEQFEHTGYEIKHLIDVKREYYLVETHYVGRITYEVIDGENRKLRIVDFKEIVEMISFDTAVSTDDMLVMNTGLNYNLVIHFKNEMSIDLHGRSDYSVSLEAKSKKLNELLNTTYSVIRKHSDPRAIVDKDTYDSIKEALRAKITANEVRASKEGVAGITSLRDIDIQDVANMKSVDAALVESILKQTQFTSNNPMSNHKSFEYVTWDGKLDQAFAMVKLLTDMLYEAVGLSKMIVSPDVATANLSGVSYRRHVGPALRKAKMKQEAFRVGMIKLIHVVMSIYGRGADDVAIKFGDGLENDIDAVITKNQKLLDYGMTTLSIAIQEVYDMNEDQANDLISDIANERSLTQPDIATVV
jgi:hypothetical protein